MLHQNIDWEMVNDISFTAVYLVIEVWNCGVKNFQYGGYIIIQLMLDYAIFWLCFILMEMTSWYVPVTCGVGTDKHLFKAVFTYVLQYSGALIFSNLVIGITCVIRKYYKQ